LRSRSQQLKLEVKYKVPWKENYTASSWLQCKTNGKFTCRSLPSSLWFCQLGMKWTGKAVGISGVINI